MNELSLKSVIENEIGDKRQFKFGRPLYVSSVAGAGGVHEIIENYTEGSIICFYIYHVQVNLPTPPVAIAQITDLSQNRVIVDIESNQPQNLGRWSYLTGFNARSLRLRANVSGWTFSIMYMPVYKYLN